MNLKLRLTRIYKGPTYTIGKLYINDKYFCDTLEDTDRGLTDKMTLTEILKIKKPSETAIPSGTYNITLDIVSPRFSTKTFYKQVCNGKLPRLLNVKGFDGILIHVGEGPNGAKFTSGCLLVGLNTIKGGLTQGKECFKKLYSKLKEAHDKHEKITIIIK